MTDSPKPALRTDAFGGVPPASPAPAPAASSPQANASPPAAQVNTPAPAPAPAPTPAANTTAQPHMPKVGTVTAANPTGDPAKDPNLTPQAGDNSGALDDTKAKLIATVAGLGQTRGAGTNSLGELAILICQSAKDGTISPDTKSTDIADLWNAFAEAQNKARVDYDPTQAKDNSAQVQVSKLRTFAKLGALTPKQGPLKFDPAKLLTRTRDLIPKITGMKLSSYSALVLVAREQSKLFKSDDKCKALTDAQIKGYLSPVETEDNRTLEQYELDELEAINKRIVRLTSGTDERGPCESSEATKGYEILNGRILALRKKLGVKDE